MKARSILLVIFSLLFCLSLNAQPSFRGIAPTQAVIKNTVLRREAYESRINEVLAWYSGFNHKDDPTTAIISIIAAKLARHEDLAYCDRSVISLMKEPGSGPFWMFPSAEIALLGQGQLSAEAQKSIRKGWKTQIQTRGDTENHWLMYYTSLYLMSELYPHEAGDTWYNGKSSDENLAESKEYIISWIGLVTSVGQGEYNPTHYIGEYAIPMLMLATYAKDSSMKQRGHMILDLLFADLAESSINGVLHAPNSRTDDKSVIEHWNSLSSFFTWLLYGNTPAPYGYASWGGMFAALASNYEVPDVIYRIAVDRSVTYLQKDLKRTRRRWRNSDVLMGRIYKTNYTTLDYAVGSYQGGLSDPIQTHVWDVTWAVPDPRDKHNTMFSVHPISSNADLQTYFTDPPDEMVQRVMFELKPSYDWEGKFLGGSRFEQVMQNLDTIIALYDIPADVRFGHINGFFSKDLADLTVDKSGWIFARGGNAYLAYRPLAPYTFNVISRLKPWLPDIASDNWDKRLYSPYRKNGTILQVASSKEFKDFQAFKNAILALPLSYKLDPQPSVSFTSLRGNNLVFTYGKIGTVNGNEMDYSKWKLYESPYLNSESKSNVITITYGQLKRVLNFNTLNITDTSN